MKKHILILFAVPVLLLANACDDKEKLNPTENLGIPEMYSPPADADPRIKSVYDDYGIWIRMSWTNWTDVYNSGLTVDNGANRYQPTPVADEHVGSSLTYVQTLLGNTSAKFTNSFFPLEWWLLGSYGGGYWSYDLRSVGRNRFVMCWPNKDGDLPEITDPQEHYYHDAQLAWDVWLMFGQMCASHMEEPIKEFVLAGKAYDNGAAMDKITDQYYSDGDEEKYDAAVAELCMVGGFVTGSGSRNFNNDFGGWMAMLATTSYEVIKADFLDHSPAGAAKYAIIVDFFKQYGWDIQAAGNKYSQKHDEYLASLPEPEPEEPETPEEP